MEIVDVTFVGWICVQDDLNFKETEMHKSQSTAVSLDSGETYCLDLFFNVNV